jgi:hypothetical protein
MIFKGDAFVNTLLHICQGSWQFFAPHFCATRYMYAAHPVILELPLSPVSQTVQLNIFNALVRETQCTCSLRLVLLPIACVTESNSQCQSAQGLLWLTSYHSWTWELSMLR